jgi:hypothetical protein
LKIKCYANASRYPRLKSHSKLKDHRVKFKKDWNAFSSLRR